VQGDVKAVNESLLRQGVIVRPISIYEMPEHLRVTVGLEPENEKFLKSLAIALETAGGAAADTIPKMTVRAPQVASGGSA
jgi:histidinol-phosphate aminotransferase